MHQERSERHVRADRASPLDDVHSSRPGTVVLSLRPAEARVRRRRAETLGPRREAIASRAPNDSGPHAGRSPVASNGSGGYVLRWRFLTTVNRAVTGFEVFPAPSVAVATRV